MIILSFVICANLDNTICAMIIPQKPTSPLMSATVNETSSAQVELIGKEMEAHGRSIQSTTDVFPTPSTIAAPTPIETDALSAKTIAAWIAGDLSYEVANDTAKAVAVSLSSTECIAQVPRTLEWIVSTGARVAVVFGLRELEDPCARLLLRYLSDKGMLQVGIMYCLPLDITSHSLEVVVVYVSLLIHVRNVCPQ